MSETEPYRRRSARVLLLDSTGRILLLRFVIDPTVPERGHGWVTPGGGVHDGESLQDAAARELHEEIGLMVTPHSLGRPVAHCAGYADLGWASGLFRDDFFYHRVDAHDVDVRRMEALERTHHAGDRWWPLNELASTTDTIFPFGLAPLLADILAGRIPEQSVQLPWRLATP
ncbi:NUDIX domain-containing protein [Micromonospora sp. AP08]|uniref:NUDIX hydrolase n=1 Tax=Micromonospora sp. AP08 TaxID=2604467 RepID=UPI0011D69652|nr:NUDIX domain-containing protein [Micromonospora sp. AP08]TYB40356.1 NUDIX domain-containing protein [Micromonospora sp. AP08]